MNTIDGKTLKARFVDLADALGGKAPGDAGIKAWTIALRDFPIEQVVGCLDLWAQTRTKMPAPAEIRKILTDRLSDEIEAKAREERVQFEASSRRILSDASRSIAKQHLTKIKGILDHSPRNGDAWWHSLISRMRASEKLGFMQQQNATKAWIAAGRPAEWDLQAQSEAEREAAEERAAIQAEGA